MKITSHKSLFVGLSLVGCASVFVPKVAALKVGVSTEADAIASLGKTGATILQPDGFKLDQYRLTGYRTSPWNSVPLIGLFAGAWPNVKLVRETLTFDPHGTLVKASQSSDP
jgi:hypothetical protein